MLNLFVMYETFTNGYRAGIMDIFFLVSIFCGIFVIISTNPVVSVLFLIGLFLSIAIYLMTLGISFIGLSYLLVYVGAVSILFLFILMLINIRISELLSDTSNSIALAAIIAVCIFYPVNQVLLHSCNSDSAKVTAFFYLFWDMFNFETNYISLFKNIEYLSNECSTLLFVTGKIWDGSIAETTHITSIGNIMYTSYMIWLIITSIILLLAMVGGIVITIKQKS